MYDEGYADHVATMRSWLEANVVPVGRNGMHRYNNQDHSMLTAMLAVENLLGASHDLWGQHRRGPSRAAGGVRGGFRRSIGTGP